MRYVDYMQFYLSGGAGNTLASASLGGVLSQTRVRSQDAVSGMAGVSVLNAYDNALGAGTLSYNSVAQTLAWADSGYADGDPVDVSLGGEFVLLSSNNGAFDVQVAPGSLPVGNATSSITISPLANQAMPDVSGNEHLIGVTRHVCLYMKNASPIYTFNMYLWIAAQPNAGGNESMKIGIDPAPNSQYADAISDPRHAPGGVVFSAPGNSGDGLFSFLLPGEFKAFWIKRETLPNNQQTTATITAGIGYGVNKA